ncbi:hypothetical protein CUN34_08285 [Enterococcus faecium]|nr:hypothetical protein CKY08_12660 [Enterococcus faecium]PQD42568.1 hypothetical protein CUM56_14030 [Enterococcus faecalis]PQB63374.1 hypothetical protein CUN34_08285 [Enterococcus faecium]PQB76802.1 hypothetical protein CUN36_06440 [Enterococcus faecium]PQB98468.1 hypothetical protein CUN33_07700 [Enterococcus faecium]
MFIFDTEYILNAMKYRVEKLKFFIDSTYFSSDWSSFIFNVIRLSFLRNDKKLREFVFSSVTSTSFDKSVIDKPKFVAFKLLHQLSQDKNDQQVKKDLSTILKTIQIVGDTNLLSFLKQIQTDILKE